MAKLFALENFLIGLGGIAILVLDISYKKYRNITIIISQFLQKLVD